MLHTAAMKPDPAQLLAGLLVLKPPHLAYPDITMFRATIISTLLAALTLHAVAIACPVQTLQAHGEMLTVSGVGEVDLGTADDRALPTAWQGPISVGACSLEVGIIEAPFLSTRPAAVFVTTYSGAMRQLVLIDFTVCKVTWRSEPFVGAVQVEAAGLKLGKSRLNFDARCGLKLER